MVDNPAEKVDKCPLKSGFAYNWECENCPLSGVAGCPLFRVCISIGVNGRAVWTFGINSSGVQISRDRLFPFCLVSSRWA